MSTPARSRPPCRPKSAAGAAKHRPPEVGERGPRGRGMAGLPEPQAGAGRPGPLHHRAGPPRRARTKRTHSEHSSPTSTASCSPESSAKCAPFGFTRYDTDGRLVIARPRPWAGLAARRRGVRGGVFIALDERRADHGRTTEPVLEIAAATRTRRAEKLPGRAVSAGHAALPPPPHPRAPAHPPARVRMRLCVGVAPGADLHPYRRRGRTQAGILIYTAAGDVEGTLGGLARQGEPPRLARTLLNALQGAVWCSSDPICRESRGRVRVAEPRRVPRLRTRVGDELRPFQRAARPNGRRRDAGAARTATSLSRCARRSS